ncbi:equilibrative nucleoside transporter 1 [Lepeophtheirus salmonis]|uniref:equilibrative nucleoside transporter 1 n=1 Tax=Lepeophtheirus salmonis TaxID=72036 RepID=UPI001AE50801|nr:equilibrative nucleoside transporter 1-like [Lepeophtheirus salmonis]
MSKSIFGSPGSSDNDDDDDIQIIETDRPDHASFVQELILNANLEEAPHTSQKYFYDEGIVTDRYHRVLITFYIFGMSSLLPWNFFISAEPFWDYKFRNTSASEEDPLNKTKLQTEFWSYLSIASNVPMSICVVLNAFFGQRFPLSIRIAYNLMLIIALFILVCILAFINTDSWQTEFMHLILTIVVIMNVGLAVLQGGIYGLGGKFPPKYMGSIVSGGAMGGIFPSLLNVIVIATFSHSRGQNVVGFVFFLIATFFLVLTLISYFGVKKTTFFCLYNDHRSGENEMIASLKTIGSVTKRSWMSAVTVFLTFSVTLAVFPAVTVHVTSFSENKTWSELYFTPVTCFLLFNIMDYIGREIASRFPLLRKKASIILALSILRIFFIPAFMLCNISPGNRNLPVFFHSDSDYIFLMTAFGLSNGYLGAFAMIHGPDCFEEPELQEMVGMILVAFLCLGTAVGSLFSYCIINGV